MRIEWGIIQVQETVMKCARYFGSLLLALSVMLGAGSAVAAAPTADATLVTYQIRYSNAEAGEVALIWGINGWQFPQEELHPPGTAVFPADKPMLRTPMTYQDGMFVASLHLPVGTKIDYFFQISKTRSGVTIEAWDDGALSDKQFYALADTDSSSIVQATTGLAELSYTSPADIWIQLMSTLVLLVIGLALSIVATRMRYHDQFLDF
jgi:hypothetical protein